MRNYPGIWLANLVLYISFLLLEMKGIIFNKKIDWGLVIAEVLICSFLLAFAILVISMIIAAFPVRQKAYRIKIRTYFPYVTFGFLLVMLVCLVLVSGSSPIH